MRTNYEEWPLNEEIGELSLRIHTARKRCLVFIAGKEFRADRYEADPRSWAPVSGRGAVRGVLGDLYTLVPEYPGTVEPERQRRIDLGYGAARFYPEDRVLAMEDRAEVHLPKDEQVEIRRLFEAFARHRYPEATRLYTHQPLASDEPILRRLGYRLFSENRQRPRYMGRSRTWVK